LQNNFRRLQVIGVYQITNAENGKIYIGSSTNITTRWEQHLYELSRNKHDNYKLQADFNKYGYKAFTFQILELADNEKTMYDIEQEYLDEFDIDNNYNILSYVNYGKLNTLNNISKVSNIVLHDDQMQLLKANVTIVTHAKLNAVGKELNALSKAWFSRKQDRVDRLKLNLSNYYKHIASGKIYWTSFLSHYKKVCADGTVKSFVPFHEIPEHKRNDLAYLANNFQHLAAKNANMISDDQYALNILLYWICNVSDITVPIKIYIPSSRMRNIFKNWLQTLK